LNQRKEAKMFLATLGSTLSIWNPDSGALLAQREAGGATDFFFAPDGCSLLTLHVSRDAAGPHDKLKLWSVPSLDLNRVFVDVTAVTYQHARFNKPGDRFVTSGYTDSPANESYHFALSVWSVDKENHLARFDSPYDVMPITYPYFMEDNISIVFREWELEDWGGRCFTKLWDAYTESPKHLYEIPVLAGMNHEAVCFPAESDDLVLVVNEEGSRFSIYRLTLNEDVLDCTMLCELRGHVDTFGCSFNMACTLVASPSFRTLKIFDISTGNQPFTLVYNKNVGHCAFHPSQNILAIGTQQSIEMIDTTTGQRVSALEAQLGRCRRIRFSPHVIVLL
jgi:hypothetical protein